MPPTIGMMLSYDKSLIVPLSTTLGVEDLHDLIEIQSVDDHNRRKIAKLRRTE